LKANHVLVIGGGITGVELTAELVTKFPDLQVTLVHSGDRLLPDITKTEKPRNYITQFYQLHNVSILLNQRVLSELPDHSGFVTNLTTVKADFAFLCGSGLPNSEIVGHTALKSGLGLTVNQHLQVKGYNHIFAGGDVVDSIGESKDYKLAQTAEIQAEVIANNILTCQEYSIFPGKIPRLESYIPSDRIMIISLGKFDGILVWKSICITGFIPALLKEAVEWQTLTRFWKWDSCFKFKEKKKTGTRIDV